MTTANAIQPIHADELRRILADWSARGLKAGTIDLRRLDRIVAFVPEDMTVTVEAGIRLGRLQAELARERQWLPLDPPDPDHLTVEALLSANASGPRRFGFGTARDHTLGLRVILGDGRLIQSGGRVVKNVAGYDLAKLFIGSRGSLGVIVEATFKLRPLPEIEEFVQARCPGLDAAGALIESVLDSELTPVVLDLHNQPSAGAGEGGACWVVLGLAGTREDVAWQKERAAGLGLCEPGTLRHETEFWTSGPPPARQSALPSRLVEVLRDLGGVSFVARAGNGLVYYRGGGPSPARGGSSRVLLDRLKKEFDPKGILPEVPA